MEAKAPGDRRFISAREVAAMFEVSPSTVVRWARDGRLPALVTPGGRLRFLRESIEGLINIGVEQSAKSKGGTP